MQSVSLFLDLKYKLERRFKKLLECFSRVEGEGGQAAENILYKLEKTRTKLEELCVEVIRLILFVFTAILIYFQYILWCFIFHFNIFHLSLDNPN